MDFSWVFSFFSFSIPTAPPQGYLGPFLFFHLPTKERMNMLKRGKGYANIAGTFVFFFTGIPGNRSPGTTLFFYPFSLPPSLTRNSLFSYKG